MQARSPVVSANVTERYAALIELGHVLTGILRPADLYEALGARLDRALRLDAFFLSRVDDAADQAAVVHRSDLSRSNGESAGGSFASYRASACLAIRDRRPVLHLPGDPAPASQAVGLDSRSRPAISAPILREGRSVGVLTAIGPTGSVYDTADMEFLAATADLLAPALARSNGDASNRPELDSISEITQAVALLSTNDALDRTASAAHQLCSADGTALWLVRTGGDVEVAHNRGPLAPRRGEKLALSHDLFRHLAGQRDPISFDNRTQPANGPGEFHRLTRAATGLVVPLHAQDRLLGALVVCYQDARPPLTAEAIASLQRMANLAAIAAGYARLNEQLSTLSLIDPLTGIPNRRQLALYLDKEFAAARRGRRLTLLLFDIDEFEQYNRRNGKQSGDAVLRAFAEMLVTQTRAMNLAARFEGDAFIVALADADRRAGFIHASRIARAAEAHPLVGPSGIHASVGISSYAPRMKGYEDLISAAEKDLDIRRSGGNRLTI